MIDLNPQREEYVKARGKVVLKACPGSGKTTTIAYKLHSLIEEEYNNTNGPGIACLSFTNTAKEEINQKYLEFSKKSLSHPHTVSTIDSFINTWITLPFYYLISGKYERPHILDENSDLDSFTIPELWDNHKKKYKHLTRENKPLLHSYKPSSIVKDLSGNYTFNGNIPDSTKVDIQVFNDYAKAIKTWQFKSGILTNSDSTFLALNMLSDYPHIAEALAHRYSFFIIDEAQDTSEIQHLIFERLVAKGLTNIELVGDPYQSLYVWRGAKPKFFLEKYSDTTWTGLDLSDNWRSTQTIINTYSLLRSPKDEVITARKKFDNELPVYVLTFEEGKETQALEKYEKLCKSHQKNHAVTRGTDLSIELNGISKVNNYWKYQFASKIIDSIAHRNNNNLKSAIDTLRWVIVNLLNPKLSYKDKREKLKELKSDNDLNAQLNTLLIEFSDFNMTLVEWTAKTEKRLTEYFKLQKVVSFDLKKGTFSPNHKRIMSDLFSDALVKWSFPISTIHKVKGMTLDTLLLFLHKNGHSISLSDIVPSDGQLTEYQTMIYVAMSRPKHILAIAIENTVDAKEVFRRLGCKIEIR